MNVRRRIPAEIENEVLIRSRRRCCLCFGLENDLEIKKGQIAHIDQKRENNSEDNLAFTCLYHHDQYDSITSQSKNITSKEIKHYRHLLYAHFQNEAAASSRHGLLPLFTEDDIKEALIFHTGTHRSQAALLSLISGQKDFYGVNEEVLPSNEEWTEVILHSVINYGWARESPISPGNYEITLNGKRMLAVLELLPANVKDKAWKEIWQPEIE